MTMPRSMETTPRSMETMPRSMKVVPREEPARRRLHYRLQRRESPSTWPPGVVCHLPNSAVADARRASPALATKVWWRIRHHPERYLSLPEIARLFGRDHTTIKAGIEAHAQRLAVAAIATSEAGAALRSHAMGSLRAPPTVARTPPKPADPCERLQADIAAILKVEVLGAAALIWRWKERHTRGDCARRGEARSSRTLMGCPHSIVRG